MTHDKHLLANFCWSCIIGIRLSRSLLLLACTKSHMLSASRRQSHLLHVSAVDPRQIWPMDKSSRCVTLSGFLHSHMGPRGKQMMPPADRIYRPGQGAKKDVYSDDLERSLTRVSKSLYTYKSNIWKTVHLRDKFTIGKPYAIYRMVPLSITLIDPWPVFQGRDNFQHWLSQKRHEIET